MDGRVPSEVVEVVRSARLTWWFGRGERKSEEANDGMNGLLGLSDTNHRGETPGEMGVNLPAVDLGTHLNVSDFALGTRHSCAIVTGASAQTTPT